MANRYTDSGTGEPLPEYEDWLASQDDDRPSPADEAEDRQAEAEVASAE